MPVIAENIKKVAVVMTGETTQFVELDQGRPLAAVIQDLCNVWTLSEPDDYALQFNEPTKKNFITERNRVEITNGNVLKLTHSPAKTASQLLELLKSASKAQCLEALKRLSTMSQDITLAQEFINKKGLFLIVEMLEEGNINGDALSFTLKTFLELMEHGIVSWDILEHKFIKQISATVMSRTGNTDPNTLQYSLEILESIVVNSSGKCSLVEQEITLSNLVPHIQSQNREIQKNTLALINALFQKASTDKKAQIEKTLLEKSIRSVILNNVVRGKHTDVDSDMAHQLYMIQCLLFNQLQVKRIMPVQTNDTNIAHAIAELRKIAFDSDSESTPNTGRKRFDKDYKKLGFKNHANPVEDLTQVPPGILALDNMTYFAKQHEEIYTKVVLENSCRADEHDCPFARASIELTNMLCDILNVGEQPSEEDDIYIPMFFAHERPFEEFYCVSIWLLNKTWKEMRATVEDFDKVLSVVREQVGRALKDQPLSFEQFKAKIATLTYAEITNIWQQERRQKEEWEGHAKPIQELREQITPEILELVKQQRLNHLIEGTRFNKYKASSGKVKGKFWYCRLSPNHKFFHYGDCEEDMRPTVEQLNNTLPVADITTLVTGSECPHTKETNIQRGIKKKDARNNPIKTAFSIFREGDAEPLNFIAHTENEFALWTDGINALLSHKMESSLTRHDLDMLLSMEIKLRLLDTEGVSIPEEAPPIPKDPPNFDFAYDI